jgi:uncharacterized protein YjbI with pentapeptide repeats
VAGEASPGAPSTRSGVPRPGSGSTRRHELAWSETEQQHNTGRGDTLAIRWFTPRGRATKQEVLESIRFEDGLHLREIVAELRRGGLDESKLDLRGIDLRGEDLAAARLAGVDLSGARLDGCDLTHADLTGATLERAVLTGAKLRGAKLGQARLRDADLSRADLTEATLEGADLEHARCSGATMHRTRLAGAALSRADLAGVDLSTSFRQPQPFVDARPTVARRAPIGTPPSSEPRRPTERTLHAPFDHQRATAAAYARLRGLDDTPTTARLRPLDDVPTTTGTRQGARIIAHETVRMARAELERARPAAADLDAAIAELLGLRGKVERVTIVVDGVERVLFAGDERARASARVG